jgi:purine-cytosine permease-like protein
MKRSNFNFPLVIIAVIVGATIFKHFNFDTLTFEESWLDLVYIVVFIITLILLFKKKKTID